MLAWACVLAGDVAARVETPWATGVLAASLDSAAFVAFATRRWRTAVRLPWLVAGFLFGALAATAWFYAGLKDAPHPVA